MKIVTEISGNETWTGYRFSGFISPTQVHGHTKHSLPRLGNFNDLEKIILDNNIEQVIIALDDSHTRKTEEILNRLGQLDVVVKMVPDSIDIIAGSVKTNNVLGDILIEIKTGLLPDWQHLEFYRFSGVKPD